jgi:hypothetical protein
VSKDSPCHGLHKRYHTISGNNESSVAADTLVAQHLMIRSESPSISPERMIISSCGVDSPSAAASGSASRFSTPNHRILRKKPPPLSPYRSSSFGTSTTNNSVVGLRKPPSLDDRQRSLGSRSGGSAGSINHDTNSSPNWNNVCIISSGLGYTAQNNCPSGWNGGNRNIEGLRPRRNTLVYANLIMAILLSMLNIAFVSRESHSSIQSWLAMIYYPLSLMILFSMILRAMETVSQSIVPGKQPFIHPATPYMSWT